MADKQPQLNGAFYGPAVPPPTKTYHRHGHGRGCACCLLSTFLKLVVTIVVVVGLAVLILWLVFRPNEVKFHVTDAKLTQFNLTGNQLHYNLALNLTIRNPNRRIGVYYDTIEASTFYKDQRLNTNWLPPFYQGHKTTTVLTTNFNSQPVVVLGGNDMVEFNAEKLAGVYDIDVDFRLRLRLKFGVVRIGKFKPKVRCGLKLPVSSDVNSAVPFQTTRCDFDF
ncbi:NDR1/HIN1-like protein 10 [Momordica charantia]|uniref:NDR1/HIN1-like protein 10 n=1 Tax=Momordica charantia TaxID=3673 RepID=A0A6J1CSE3_MOMCH|nr:NDR1/HIN1-like protein 10 [Momordica charantia]